jgi:hypothetical protein
MKRILLTYLLDVVDGLVLTKPSTAGEAFHRVADRW